MVTGPLLKPFCISIDGVSLSSISMKREGGKLSRIGIGRDGEIYALDSRPAIVIIEIKIEPGINVFGFNVDGNKNITPAKNYSQVGRVYRKKVPIHILIQKGKEPCTQYNENHIRLLEIFNDGHFVIHEVAIVFQNGSGFLTIQKVYNGTLYNDYGIVYCPEFSGRWSQLVDFINGACKESGIIDVIPFVEEMDDPKPKLDTNVDTEKLDDNTGIIDWFNVARGHGIITTNKGSAFVDYRDISSLTSDRLICLSEGQEVLFKELVKNPDKESTIPFKALGVLTA